MYTVAYDECSKLILHGIVSKSMQSRQANSKTAWKFWGLEAFGMGDTISSSRDVLFGIFPSHSFWRAMNSQSKRRGTLQGRQCQHHPAEECTGLQCGGARRSKLQTTSNSIMNHECIMEVLSFQSCKFRCNIILYAILYIQIFQNPCMLGVIIHIDALVVWLIWEIQRWERPLAF